MLWRAGLTPGGEGGPRTGESAGNVVRRRWKPPCSRRRLRFGSLPSGHVALGQRRVEAVEPQEDQLLTLACLYPCLPVTAPHSDAERPEQEADQAQEQAAEEREERPRKAKPAPGPM